MFKNILAKHSRTPSPFWSRVFG